MPDRVTLRSRGEIVKHDRIPDPVRERFLELLHAKPAPGNVAALVQAFRDSGEYVFKGEVRHLLDDDVKAEAREARGWDPDAVTDTLYEIGRDKDHPQVVRAATLLLQAHGGPEWRTKGSLELSGPDGQPVAFEDRSASLDDVARVLTATGALDRSTDDQPTVAAPGNPVASSRDV